MTPETALLFVFVAILPAISPGPAILLAVSNSLRFGPWATVWSAFGNALGLFLLGFAVSYGLGTVMAASEMAFIVIKLAGATYLIVLGVRLWRSGVNLQVAGQISSVRSRGHLFMQALIVSLTNPKAMIVLAALLPPFIDPTSPLFSQILGLSAIYAVICLLNHLCLAYFAGKIKRLLQNPAHMRLTQRITGGSFVGLGIALAGSSK